MLALLLLAALLGPACCPNPDHAGSSPPPPPAPATAPPPGPRAGPRGPPTQVETQAAQARDEDDTEAPEWSCPEIGSEWEREEPKPDEGSRGLPGSSNAVSCTCDLPHTLRCTGGNTTLQVVGRALRALPRRYVSLLDATVAGVSVLTGPLLAGVALHGLVVSGELSAVRPDAFLGLLQLGPAPRLQALGLPGNLLDAVPTAALRGLPGLDRLDLSHNRLRSLGADAFLGVRNLTFLDLSDNQLTELSPAAFLPLAGLRELRLTGNRLRVSALPPLEGLRALEELDLASNQLAGPLGPAALPRLPRLRALTLAHNQLSSVRRGALAGLPLLHSLTLAHNMVDVLEDHAFRQLGALNDLDLAHNRIVAVSGASLAHLTRLRRLSLQHNFLRALTADLVRPLAALQELHLDDNDISLVAADALGADDSPGAAALDGAGGLSRLTRLTLSENPLNCDCALAPFAWFLRNASQLPTNDRASAVCAAPPHLENGLLEDVAVAELLCQDDPGPPGDTLWTGPGGRPQPLSDTRVTLRAFQFDGSRVSLLWGVDVTAAPYACDALFVYEEAGAHEVLLESTPLGCDSSQLADPRSLLLFVPAERLVPARRYRFCLVLLEGGGAQDDLALVVGCSDVLPLVKTVVKAPTPRYTPGTGPRISGLSANLTSTGALAVWVQLSPAAASKEAPKDPPCRLAVTVFAAGALAAQERLNCSLPWAVIGGLGLGQGPLQVCATAGESARTRCTSVSGSGRAVSSGRRPDQLPPAAGAAVTSGLAAALAGIVAGAAVALLLGLWLAARWRRRDSPGGGAPGGMAGVERADVGQLYRPPPGPTPNCDSEQHARYVKLHATTKL